MDNIGYHTAMQAIMNRHSDCLGVRNIQNLNKWLWAQQLIIAFGFLTYGSPIRFDGCRSRAQKLQPYTAGHKIMPEVDRTSQRKVAVLVIQPNRAVEYGCTWIPVVI